MDNETWRGEFAELSGHEYVNLITFREDNSPVQATVRFVVLGDYVYFVTPASAGKVKRIQARGRVLVAPGTSDGTPLGRTVLGLGRVVEGKEAETASQALQTKYGQAHIDFLDEITREGQGWEMIEIRAWDE